MANISKIKLPNGSIYDIKPSSDPTVNKDGIFYIETDPVYSNETLLKLTTDTDILIANYQGLTGLKLVLHYTLSTDSSTNVKLQLNKNNNNILPKNIKRDDASLESGLRPGGMYFLCFDGNNFIISNYNNTVYENLEYENPVAATPISAGNFVYCGIPTTSNGRAIYSIEHVLTHFTTSSTVDWDWGIAYCTEAVEAGNTIPKGALLRQTTIDTTGISSTTPINIYAFFKNDGPVKANSTIILDSSCVGTSTTDTNATSFIYVGMAIGGKAYIDLTNHDFISIKDSNVLAYPPFTGTSITKINNREIYLPVNTVFGTCNSHTGGGDPQRGGDSGSGSGDAGGSDGGNAGGPWTGIVTINNNEDYDQRNGSTIAVYFTNDDVSYIPANAKLNINSLGAYPIYYNNAPIGGSDITTPCTAIFLYDGAYYHLVAGGTPGGVLNPSIFELKSNKVTTLSDQSTDTQFPSAKCVYDLIGDIETLLSEI